MKILHTSLCVLTLFVGFLLLPALVSAHIVMMKMHHGEGTTMCLEHCLSSVDALTTIDTHSITVLGEIFIQKIYFAKVLTYVLPLASIYLMTLYPPPGLRNKIKNSAYSELK